MNKKIIPAETSFFVPVEKVLFDHSRMRRSLETAAAENYPALTEDILWDYTLFTFEKKLGYITMSYSIDISLQIWHPSLSGNQLQALFNKIPNIKHSVGERIIRKDGEKLFTKYVDSYICYDIIPLQDYTDFYEPLKKANDIVLKIINDKGSFFELKKTGGRIIYYCAIYTKEHIVISIPYEISKELSDLGIDIGIEIFQNYVE